MNKLSVLGGQVLVLSRVENFVRLLNVDFPHHGRPLQRCHERLLSLQFPVAICIFISVFNVRMNL